MTPYQMGAIAALQKLGQFGTVMEGLAAAGAKAAPKAAKKLTEKELKALAKKKFLPGPHSM